MSVGFRRSQFLGFGNPKFVRNFLNWESCMTEEKSGSDFPRRSTYLQGGACLQEAISGCEARDSCSDHHYVPHLPWLTWLLHHWCVNRNNIDNHLTWLNHCRRPVYWDLTYMSQHGHLGIPAEMWILIFQYLDLDDLLSVCRVCRWWSQVGSKDKLWKDIFFRIWRIAPDPEVSNWKQIVRTKIQQVNVVAWDNCCYPSPPKRLQFWVSVWDTINTVKENVAQITGSPFAEILANMIDRISRPPFWYC